MKKFPTKMKRKIGAPKGRQLCGAPNGALIMPNSVLTILEAPACTSEDDQVLGECITAKMKLSTNLSLFTVKFELILCILAVYDSTLL